MISLKRHFQNSRGTTCFCHYISWKVLSLFKHYTTESKGGISLPLPGSYREEPKVILFFYKM